MIANLAKQLGTAGGLAIVAMLIVLLPFESVAVTRLLGWAWWIAVPALVLLNLVPFAGQLLCVVLAVTGAFYLGQDTLPHLVAAELAPQPASTVASANDAKPSDDFLNWKKTIVAPAIQDKCLEDVQRRGLAVSDQLSEMARACACYGAAAVNVIMPSDVTDNALTPTPEFNAKLAVEARRLCQRDSGKAAPQANQ